MNSEKINDEIIISSKDQFINRIKEMIKSHPYFIDPIAIKGSFKYLDGSPYLGKGKDGITEKDKDVIGISRGEGISCDWNPIPLNRDENQLMNNLEKELNIPKYHLPSIIVYNWIIENIDNLKEISIGKMRKEKSPEDMMKEYNSMKLKMENMKILLGISDDDDEEVIE